MQRFLMNGSRWGRSQTSEDMNITTTQQSGATLTARWSAAHHERWSRAGLMLGLCVWVLQQFAAPYANVSGTTTGHRSQACMHETHPATACVSNLMHACAHPCICMNSVGVGGNLWACAWLALWEFAGTVFRYFLLCLGLGSVSYFLRAHVWICASVPMRVLTTLTWTAFCFMDTVLGSTQFVAVVPTIKLHTTAVILPLPVVHDVCTRLRVPLDLICSFFLSWIVR